VAATRGRPARMTVSCGSGARLRLPRVIVVVGGQGEVGAAGAEQGEGTAGGRGDGPPSSAGGAGGGEGCAGSPAV
jgi:hypothetical protein